VIQHHRRQLRESPPPRALLHYLQREMLERIRQPLRQVVVHFFGSPAQHHAPVV
jgi:hypothetical protein